MHCPKIITQTAALIILCFTMTSMTNSPCSSPEAQQFNFWIGKWTLTYGDTNKATNTIIKKLDGCVIEENFDDPFQTFKGQSWSVYVPATKKWHQTWVDNQGGYIVLTGEFKDGKMILITEPVKNNEGKTIQKRMIFYHIEENSFDWNWEQTEDGGENWKVTWKIHYQRVI